jgi:hypothetical protein
MVLGVSGDFVNHSSDVGRKEKDLFGTVSNSSNLELSVRPRRSFNILQKTQCFVGHRQSLSCDRSFMTKVNEN